jgi:hypothetical protein
MLDKTRFSNRKSRVKGRDSGLLQLRLEKAKRGEWGEGAYLGGVLAEELDGAEAIVVECVADVPGEVVTDGRWGDCDAGGPLLD